MSGVGMSTALLAAGFVPAVTGAADMSAPTGSTNLSPIVVEGERVANPQAYKQERLASPKFTQPIAETPQTIQVISEGVIEDQHATTLTEALRNSPGVGTFNLGENGGSTTGDAIYMRGIDSSGSIFVDGVRDMGAVTRDMFNTEQVEVIKGSNGTNFGRATPGGAVNVVTKKARQGDFGEVNASIGTDNQYRSTVDINRQLTDTTAVRLNLMWQDSDVPGRDMVENDRWGIAPAISFGLGTDTRVHLDFLHLQQDNVLDGGMTTLAGLPNWTNPVHPNVPQPDTENFYGTVNDHDDVQIDRLTLAFEQDFGDDGTFRNVTRWARIEQEYLMTSIMGERPGAGINWPSIGRLPNMLNETRTIITNQSGIVQSLTLNNITHNLSYGLTLTHEERDETDMATPFNPATGAGYGTFFPVNYLHPSHQAAHYRAVETGASTHVTADTVGAYFFDTMEIGTQWQVTAGLRVDHFDIKQDSTSTTCGGFRSPACTGTFYDIAADPDLEFSDTLFSWQLGVLYKINDYGNVYVNYATMEQPPGGDSLAFSGRGSSQNQSSADPQKAQTVEIGTKWELFDKRLLLTAAAYHTEIDNQMVDTAPGAARDYVQIGEKEIDGLELTAVGRITPNWNVSAGFMLLDVSVKGGANGGEALPYAPTSAFTLWSTYEFPFGLTVGGGARYVGEYERPGGPGNNVPETIDDYWVVDAMASYAVTKDLDVQLNVYNILDEEYVASINRSGYRYTPGQPRSAILSVNYEF